MRLASTPHERTIDVDISSDAFWAKSFEERDESFARLRRGFHAAAIRKRVRVVWATTRHR